MSRRGLLQAAAYGLVGVFLSVGATASSIVATHEIVAGSTSSGSSPLVQFGGGGVILSVADNIGISPTIRPEDLFAFVYEFDPTLPDSDPDPGTGIYLDELSAGSIIVGIEASSTGQFVSFICSGLDVLITDNDVEFDDSYLALSGFDIDDCVALVDDGELLALQVINVAILFFDPSQTALMSDSLLLEPPNLEEWEIALALMEACPSTIPDCDPELQGLQVAGPIVLIQTPEPSMTASLFVALVALLSLSNVRRPRR